MSETSPQNSALLTQKSTFDLAFTAFILDRKAQALSKNTVRLYTVELELFGRYLAERDITTVGELSPDVIRLYLVDLGERRNPGGRRVSYRCLKTWCLWLESETDGDFRAPTRKVKCPVVPRDDDPLDPVSLPDVDAMLETCKGDWFGERDRAILTTLLDSGIRAQEVCDLDLSDYDPGDGGLTVKRGKRRKKRVTFVGKRGRRAIRRWLKERGSKPGALFLTDDLERLSYWGLRQILRRRAAQAKIDAVNLHDFRRAFCLSQLQAGVDLVTIARLMGHTTTALIARYAKQTREDLREKYRSPADGEG